MYFGRVENDKIAKNKVGPMLWDTLYTEKSIWKWQTTVQIQLTSITIKICAIVFRELLNLEKLCAHHPNFSSWVCFGILRRSSWWWAQRFSRLMHPRLSNSRKTSEQILMMPTVVRNNQSKVSYGYDKSDVHQTDSLSYVC